MRSHLCGCMGLSRKAPLAHAVILKVAQMISIAFQPLVTQAVTCAVNTCAGIVSAAHAVVKASTACRSPLRGQANLTAVTAARLVTRVMIVRHPFALNHVEITANALGRTPARATVVGLVQPARKQCALHHAEITANARGQTSALVTMVGRARSAPAIAIMGHAQVVLACVTVSGGWGLHAMNALQTPHLRWLPRETLVLPPPRLVVACGRLELTPASPSKALS